MSKTLIMIRHAQRDVSRRELDNGLTEKGREQAKAIRRFFQVRFDSKLIEGGLWLASSPKLRCQETLLPLAKELRLPIDVHPGLDEQGARETAPAFLERVKGFLAEWRCSQVEIAVLCSHGDWLPLAAQALLQLNLEMKKGAWLELEEAEDQISLKWYVPGLRVFYS